MKRFIDHIGEVEGVDHVANWLMLLSRGQHDSHDVDRTTTTTSSSSSGRVFECRTCNRQFSSFQALGGHRASHKKPRTVDDDCPVQSSKRRPRVHECSVCGLEFSIGQALGGHMRRHRNEINNDQMVVNGADHHLKKLKGGPGRTGLMCLDLNLPPLEDDLINHDHEVVFTVGYAGKTPFVH